MSVDIEGKDGVTPEEKPVEEKRPGQRQNIRRANAVLAKGKRVTLTQEMVDKAIAEGRRGVGKDFGDLLEGNEVKI
jgi:hypothetical protein